MFKQKIFEVARQIPKGQTLTHNQVTQKTGFPKAYRAVGSILSKNFDPDIPCHRVIRSDGKTGGYNRGMAKKRELLRKELDQSPK